MPWVYPPHKLFTNSILDVDKFNDLGRVVSTELAGATNEHNWQAGMVDSYADMTQDVALRAWRRSITSINSFDTTSVAMIASYSWATVKRTASSKMEITFRSRGGKVAIFASWQMKAVGAGVTDAAGCVFALDVDGEIRYGSMIGSGDPTNDLTVYGTSGVNAWKPGGAGVTLGAGAAIRGNIALKIDDVVEVGPGEHTVRVVYKHIAPCTGAVLGLDQFDMFVIEGWC